MLLTNACIHILTVNEELVADLDISKSLNWCKLELTSCSPSDDADGIKFALVPALYQAASALLQGGEPADQTTRSANQCFVDPSPTRHSRTSPQQVAKQQHRRLEVYKSIADSLIAAQRDISV